MIYDYCCQWCGHEWSSPIESGDWESCPSCRGSFSFDGLKLVRERKWQNLDEWRVLLWWRDRMRRATEGARV